MYKIRRSKICKRVILLSLMFIFPAALLLGFQSIQNSENNPFLARLFSHSVYTAPSAGDNVYFTVYTTIPNDILLFTHKDTLFTAKFELTIALEKKNNEVVKNQILQKTVQTDNFSETNSKIILTKNQTTFLIPPGNYKLIINLLDLTTRKPLTIKEDVTASLYSKTPISCTDIRFYTKIKKRLPGESDFPVIPAVRGPKDSLMWAQFYLYAKKPSLPYKVIYTIFNVQGKNVYKDSITFIPKSSIKSMIYSIGQPFSIGRYTLVANVKAGNEISKTVGTFFIKAAGQNTLIANPSSMIRPLKYIMDKKLYEEIISSDAQKQKKLLYDFWKQRDPNPKTKANELRDEFYSRVNYANLQFSLYQGEATGWRSDRGRTYILYGPPTQIERINASRSNVSRYKIWYYSNIGKKFVFLDRYGNNNYILVSEE